ncbi:MULTISPECIES: hypothetical protein [Flavobacterium]|uniref:Uncharacterized protein n=1 Tax=Flavobacterium jumunjinense TaxID=998845 RepID=A0ABV5GI79_9FLAO|nr:MULTISPECIES: hypothetical protein [Flavobacterium]
MTKIKSIEDINDKCYSKDNNRTFDCLTMTSNTALNCNVIFDHAIIVMTYITEVGTEKIDFAEYYSNYQIFINEQKEDKIPSSLHIKIIFLKEKNQNYINDIVESLS